MNLSPWARDMLERAVRSFLGAAIAVFAAEMASPTGLSLDGLQATAIAAFAAGVSALMAWLGRFVGDPNTGSWQEP